MAGRTLTLAAWGTPSHGTVVNNGDGTVTYQATAGYTGSDSFFYTVTNPQGGSVTGTVNIFYRNDGLRHYWSMEEGQGATVADQMGASNGTLAGGATLPTWTSRGA